MTCKECQRETTDGYKVKQVFRCAKCFEDWIRRSTRQETFTKTIQNGTDRERKGKHRSVE